MKRNTVLFIVLSLLVVNAGCVSRAIKEGIGVAAGAKGLYVTMPGGSSDQPSSLVGKYTSVRLQPFSNLSDTQTPANLNGLVGADFRKILIEKPISLAYGDTGRTIMITGKYIYYEKAKATGHIFGPFEEVIATVELRDSTSGELLAKANCVGRTTTSVNIGESHKAEGLAKSIHKLLKDLVTVPEKDDDEK